MAAVDVCATEGRTQFRSWSPGGCLADRLVSLRDTSQQGTPMTLRAFQRAGWIGVFPPLTWLAEYRLSWLRYDAIAGVTLAAYAIPVSLAYAGLAGLRRRWASMAICLAV